MEKVAVLAAVPGTTASMTTRRRIWVLWWCRRLYPGHHHHCDDEEKEKGLWWCRRLLCRAQTMAATTRRWINGGTTHPATMRRRWKPCRQ